MAIRTISAAGGNWNATSSWVEGVVPVAGDDIIGGSASGNLTVNVNTGNIRQWLFNDETGAGQYAGTLTLNARLDCVAGSEGATFSASPLMSSTGSNFLQFQVAGNSFLNIQTNGFTFSQSTRIIPSTLNSTTRGVNFLDDFNFEGRNESQYLIFLYGNLNGVVNGNDLNFYRGRIGAVSGTKGTTMSLNLYGGIYDNGANLGTDTMPLTNVFVYGDFSLPTGSEITLGLVQPAGISHSWTYISGSTSLHFEVNNQTRADLTDLTCSIQESVSGSGAILELINSTITQWDAFVANSSGGQVFISGTGSRIEGFRIPNRPIITLGNDIEIDNIWTIPSFSVSKLKISGTGSVRPKVKLGNPAISYNTDLSYIDFEDETFYALGSSTLTDVSGATTSFPTGGGTGSGGGPSSLTFLS